MAPDTITEDSSRASTGWETFLQGLIDAGWQINGTWPTRTELGNRTRSMGAMPGFFNRAGVSPSSRKICRWQLEKNTLVPCVTNCRLRSRDLQSGSVAPVDLAQASIGPGMAVFTRYSKVMESDGSPMTVRTALGLINQVSMKSSPSRKENSTQIPAGPWRGSSSSAWTKALLARPRHCRRRRTPP